MLDPYRILGTPAEAVFDDLARLAARAGGAPAGGIYFLDGPRTWRKAGFGDAPPELPPERTATGPSSFLSAPILSRRDGVVGFAAAFDAAPRAWGPDAAELLVAVARLVADRLECRRLIDELGRAREPMERVMAEEARRSGWERAELLESVIEQISDAVLVVDESGGRLMRNSAAIRLVGVASPDAGPRDWAARFGFYLPDEKTPVPPDENPLALVRKGEEPRDVLLFLRNPAHPAGRWVSVNATALRGPDGGIRGGIFTLRDVTERRVAERLLREDEERFRAMATSAFEGLVLSSERRVLEVNEAFCAMTGYAPAELIGRDIESLVSPEYRELMRARVAADSPEAYEAVLVRKDGGRFPAELRGRAVDYRGRRVRVKAVRDIGPRREAERTIRDGLRRTLAQQDALRVLTRGTAGDLEHELGEILRTAARTLGVERASLWMLSADHSRICCPVLYEATPDRMSSEADLKRSDCPAYFAAMEGSDLIAADDAELDPRTSAFAEAYLRPKGITSMLDAPVTEEGSLKGVLCLEHVGPRRSWTQDERTFALAAGGLVSRALGEGRRRESEERLRDFLENAHDFVIILEPDGRYTYVNRAWRDALGYSLEEARGLSWEDVVVPEQVAELRPRWERLVRLGEDMGRIDVTCRAKDGRRIQARGRVDCFRVDGRPMSVRGIFQDVTEQESVSEELRRSQAQLVRLEEKAGARTSLERLVGKSAAMRDVFERLRLAAQSDVTVLLTGETGTGKELAAAAVHALSGRRSKRFLAVNCSAIPDALLESELFGHVRGAFTGALRDKVGLFQAAEGGTLFLDEVGDMSPALQVKVLRALQEREVRRVGDERSVKVDVRLIAATNRDLPALVAEGKVREDFYYRIRVFQIPLPPLRERREDIPPLLDAFLKEFSRSVKKPVREVTPDALRALLDHPWPGNVRELRNAVEHAFVTLRDGRLTLDDLPPELRAPAPAPSAARLSASADEREEKERVLDALRRANGRRLAAARLLGVSRGTLWNRMKRYGIDG